MKTIFLAASLFTSTLSALAAAQTAPPAPAAASPPAAAPVAVPAPAPQPVAVPAPAPQPVAAPAPAPQPVVAPAPAPQPVAPPAAAAPQPAAVQPAVAQPAVDAPPPPGGAPFVVEGDKGEDDSGSSDPPRIHVGLNVDQLWHGQRSYDLFSDDDMQASIGASAGYAVWIDGPWSVVPEIGFGVDDREGGRSYGGAIEAADLASVRAYAGARLRYLLLPFLEPHVRLAGGFERLEASVRADSGERFDGTAHPVFGSLGAGFSLHTTPGTLTRRRGGVGALVLGVLVEGGYTVSQSMDLALATGGAAPRVRTDVAGFGTLERSGPYVRIGADVRF